VTESSELVITRVLDAPRTLVWETWTTPEHLMQWWGPKGSEMLSATVDLRPGGTYHYGMRVGGGQEIWGRFVFREITAPERLVFVMAISDPEGGITRSPWDPTWPLEVLTTVTFAEAAGRTTLTLTAVPVDATDAERKSFRDGHASMRGGFGGSFDRLEALLARIGEADAV
jgi:uncharacterized protein YndB with AHSA1/START domain